MCRFVSFIETTFPCSSKDIILKPFSFDFRYFHFLISLIKYFVNVNRQTDIINVMFIIGYVYNVTQVNLICYSILNVILRLLFVD